MPERGQKLFEFTLWGFVFGAHHITLCGVRQGLAIDLTIRRQRQCIDMNIRARQHVNRQLSGKMRMQPGYLGMTGKPGNQPWLMVLIRSGHDDDVGDTGTVTCAGLDFTQLDAKTADLDLKVITAKIVNGAIGAPAPQITRLIQACAGCG